MITKMRKLAEGETFELAGIDVQMVWVNKSINRMILEDSEGGRVEIGRGTFGGLEVRIEEPEKEGEHDEESGGQGD